MDTDVLECARTQKIYSDLILAAIDPLLVQCVVLVKIAAKAK